MSLSKLIAPVCSLLALVPSIATAARYEVEPFAKVRFLVEGPLDDVEGLTRSVSGELRLDPARWSEGSANLAVDLRTVRTGIDKRDEDMRDQFLDTDHYPRAILEVTRIENPTLAALAPGQSVEGDALGSFEIHGQRRAVRFKVRLRLENDGRLTASGAFPVVLADYGVQRPERLLLKLGSVAQVSFDASFRKVDAPPPPPESPQAQAIQPTVREIQPPLPPPLRQARRPRTAPPVALLFPNDPRSAISRGERAFHAVNIGGEGNQLSCSHCHAKLDERDGYIQKDGHTRAAKSLFRVAMRPRWWNGFATTLTQAVQLCAKINMRAPEGLTAGTADDLAVFLQALATDPAPELDYRVLYRTFESPLKNPTGGDAARGEKLAVRYCMTCHLSGRAAPVLVPGLYEAEWVVRRVRRLEGHQDKQEPPFTIDRLPDSELRDIVTWLTSPKSAPPVFRRKSESVPPASAVR